MTNNILQIPVQIGRDAKRDVLDCIDNCSNTELITCSALLGLAVVFTPHLLALNGAISLLGSAGRASKQQRNGFGCPFGVVNDFGSDDHAETVIVTSSVEEIAF